MPLGVKFAFVACIWAAAALPAAALPIKYFLSGAALGRIVDGKALYISHVGMNLQWRLVLALKPDEINSGERIDRLQCDPAGLVCFTGINVTRTGGAIWRKVEIREASVGLEGEQHWPGNLGITDVDRDGRLLATAEAKVTPTEGDLAPGVHLIDTGRSGAAAMQLAPRLKGGADTAHFVDPARSASPVFVVQGGAEGRWMIFSPDGQRIAAQAPSGEVVGIRQTDVVFLRLENHQGENSTALVSATIPQKVGQPWGRPHDIYAPSSIAAPHILHASTDNRSVIGVTEDGRLFGAAGTPFAPFLAEFCPSDPEGLRAVDLTEAPIPSDAQAIGVTAQGSWMLVSGRRVNGSPFYRLIDAQRTAPFVCGRISRSIELEAEDTAAPKGVRARVFKAKATDGESLDYAIIGKADAGPIIFKAYGAYNAPVLATAGSPFEQAWLASGGRIVAATLRGDFREPYWREAHRADYQKQAADDLISIVTDVKQRFHIDQARIIALGVSAGAFTVARATLERPDLFSTAMLVSGAFDLAELDREGVGDVAEIGSPAGDFRNWLPAQPNTLGCRAPKFLIFHSDNDERAGIENVKSFLRYLKSLKYSGSFTILQGPGHELFNTTELPGIALPQISETVEGIQQCAPAA